MKTIIFMAFLATASLCFTSCSKELLEDPGSTEYQSMENMAKMEGEDDDFSILLTGDLYDQDTLVVSDASVELFYVDQLMYMTRTDQQGHYSIVNIFPGTYELVIRKTGYQELRLQLDLRVSEQRQDILYPCP